MLRLMCARMSYRSSVPSLYFLHFVCRAILEYLER